MPDTLPEHQISSPEVREALRQSEERFRLLVDCVREYAIFMLDPDGLVASWNTGAERIKGYRADEIIGRHFSVFYPEADIVSGKPARELEIAMVEGMVEDDGWRLRRDGSRFWANVVITALRDADGHHIGFAKVTRDLTDRRQKEHLERSMAEGQLRASEQRFASFAEHLPGLAWVKDLDGRYTYVNDAAARAFNGTRDSVLGRSDHDIFDPETADEFRENDRRALEAWTGVQVIEHLRDARGVLRHSIVSKFPIADSAGQFRLIGGVAIDITDRVNAEAALRSADRRKNEFLATLSHELRNPLAPIRNAVHLLRTSADEIPRDRIFQMLEQQIAQLVRLIDDLLEVSRITTGKIDLRREAVDLREVVQSAVDASGALISAKQHTLEVEAPDASVIVTGDAVRLVQVVVNLLNNAAKYTNDGGRIWLTLRREGADAILSVRDTGTGIPSEMLPRVFEMFTQVDRTLKRSQGGLGIGLALARNLVEMHGGRIEARSRGLDLGSEFVVRLRTTAASGADAHAATGDGSMATRARILVVDDNRDAADSLTLVLTAMGAEVWCVYDGPAAVATTSALRPDVVLLDLGMPGMDGYEVARKIRAQRTLQDVRLIALTGWGSSDDRCRTQVVGFDEHWVKPVEPAKLAELIKV